MKQEIASHGKTYLIEDGIITLPSGKRISGTQIIEVKDAPKAAREACKSIDLSDFVWFCAGFTYRDIAEIAVAQSRQVAKDHADNLAARVPGLDLLRAALADEDRYARQFNRMMEDESNDGARPPKPVKANLDNLREQYPIAAAYIHAESYSLASNYAKSSAGSKAIKAIEAGQDAIAAIATMEKEWSDYCMQVVD